MNKYGLIGKGISYSYSKKVHEYFYKKFNLNANYKIIDIDEKDLVNQISELRSQKYHGYNVTIPYKEIVLQYVDKKDQVVSKLGVCNTLLFKDNKVCAHNTDYYGFKYMIAESNVDFSNKNVYILGTGASSKTIELVLSELGCNYHFVSRNPKSKEIGYNEINEDWVDIIVNTTPVGSLNLNKRILEKDFVKDKIVFDLTYNPCETLLMKDARQGFNGLTMLIVQAFYSLKLWYEFDYLITKEDIIVLKGELLK